MHIRGALPVCLLLSLVASQASAQFRPSQPPPGENYNVELGMRFWFPEPGIIIGSDSLPVVDPTGVDFVQEFNITEKKFNEFRAVLRGGKNELRVAHVNMAYNEAARLQRTIEFGGRVFNVDAAATADLAVGPVAHRLRARLREDRPRPVRRHRRGRLQPRRRRPQGHRRGDHGGVAHRRERAHAWDSASSGAAMCTRTFRSPSSSPGSRCPVSWPTRSRTWPRTRSRATPVPR